MDPPARSMNHDSESSAGFWVIGDDPLLRDIVHGVVARTGTLVRAMSSVPDDLADLSFDRPNWLLADLGSRSVSPNDLERLKELYPHCQLFLVADHPNAPVPAELARLGVRHWFLRPLDPVAIRKVFRAAIRSRRNELDRQRRRRLDLPRFKDLLGKAPSFRNACEMAIRAAVSPSTVVLIEGETGTGKGVFARAIHKESPRSKEAFVEVNCASLPGTLLESELFGHEKGAFTHAQSAKPGLLELADSGTFLLDEVAETDPQVQAKILKFLDSGRYRRVGGIEEREIDVRVLAATQKDLEQETRSGRFRRDLFHRLHVIRVRIPPVRERPGDIRILLEHFLSLFAQKEGNPDLRWSTEALRTLSSREWPGNVREIVNLCERVVLLSRGKSTVGLADLPETPIENHVVIGEKSDGRLKVDFPEGFTFEAIERAVLEDALEKVGGNVSAAATRLGMGRGQLRYRMEKLGMVVPGAPRRGRRCNPPRAA